MKGNKADLHVHAATDNPFVGLRNRLPCSFYFFQDSCRPPPPLALQGSDRPGLWNDQDHERGAPDQADLKKSRYLLHARGTLPPALLPLTLSPQTRTRTERSSSVSSCRGSFPLSRSSTETSRRSWRSASARMRSRGSGSTRQVRRGGGQAASGRKFRESRRAP